MKWQRNSWFGGPEQEDSMPAHRLSNAPVSVSLYDVAGQDADTIVHFVRHVGLANQRRSLRAGDEIQLVDMGPPLREGGDGKPVQTVGVAGLRFGDREKIRTFVEGIIDEQTAARIRGRPDKQYVILPHAVDRSEDVPYRRFSCAGFVIEAYRELEIDLLIPEAEQLPLVPIDKLIDAYGDLGDHLRDPQLRAKFGLDGEGPWPVVLAGYVLNALNRSEEDIRQAAYTPVPGDEFFPPVRD
jgi:hypothetical protein